MLSFETLHYNHCIASFYKTINIATIWKTAS